MKYNKITQEIIDELTEILGKKNVILDKEKMETYSHDETPVEQYANMPEVVVTPTTAEQIAEIVKLANSELIPITPRGQAVVFQVENTSIWGMYTSVEK